MSKKLNIILGVSGAVTGAGILTIGLGVGFYQAKDTIKARKNIAKVNELYSQRDELLNSNKLAQEAIDKANAVIAEKGSSTVPEDVKAVEEAKETIKKQEATKIENNKELETLKAKTLKGLEEVAQSVNVSQEQVKMTAEYLVEIFKVVKTKEAEKNPGLAPSKAKVAEMSTFYQEYIDKIKAIDEGNLNPDSLAWKRAIEFDWEIAQGNYKQNLQLLFSTFNWGSSRLFPASHFTRLMSRLLSNSNDPETKKTLTAWLENAKEAVANNMVLSKVFLKLHVQYILSHVFSQQILQFAKGSENSKNVTSLIDESNLSDEGKAFFKYYVTTYYQASKTGLGENLNEFILYKTNNYDSPNQTDNANEIENTIEVSDGGTAYKVYGAGLTQRDLEQRNIGLGFVTGKDEITGEKMYQQILKTQTTSSLTPKEVNQEGYDTTKTAVDNFKAAASQIADLLVGKNQVWTTTIKYDEDGSGPQQPADVSVNIRNANNEIDYQAFIKWLNQDKFFFGREDASYWTEDVKNALKTDEKLQQYIEDLKQKGYAFLIEDANKNQTYGSITNEQFYYGALSAFKGYQQFKDTTQKYGSTFFTKKVDDYGVETYRYADREYTGVGSYSGRVQKFQFNSDPYLSLPKWSVTSFANHESMMGHHNQIMYASKYLSNVDGVEFGNQFDYTSYVEGWALFMEWFGIEAKFYGTPNYVSENYYAAPTDFSVSHGITSFFTAGEEKDVTDEMVEQIKDLHNGIYWDIAGQSTTSFANDKAKALVANKIANILQYCGALNEAQLRNMRRAVDTAIHSSTVDSHSDLPVGASLKDVRDYMQANSALGIGDITSESKRYLAYVGQATSYNAGKAVMLKLYQDVLDAKGMTREEFVNDKEAVGEFFDRLLLNGALPLDALVASVHAYYGIEKE